MFDFTNWSDARLEARAAEILADMTKEGANLEELRAEAQAIKEEREARAAQQRQETRAAIAAGAGTVIARAPQEQTRAQRFAVVSVEYRNAWTRSVCGLEMSPEERSALSSAGAVIPTLTVNAVWDRLVKPAELLGRVDVTQFPSYVRFPKATTNNAATAQAVGGSISESSDVIGYVDLTPNEYVKLLTVGADIDHMAIDAVHDWIVNNLVGQIRYKINADILTGSGTNCCKGITASVNANATALTAAGVTKADLMLIMATLPAQYHNGAIWVMSANLFFNEVMTLTTLNDYIINDGFQYKLFGHDVILMSEAKVSNKETIFFGDPKAYKVNIFKALEVKAFETATTTNKQFRGATLADGELLDTSAFVRFAKT
jgi:HK97 family phage major capsid protein